MYNPMLDTFIAVRIGAQRHQFPQRIPPHPASLIYSLHTVVVLPMFRVENFPRSFNIHASFSPL